MTDRIIATATTAAKMNLKQLVGAITRRVEGETNLRTTYPEMYERDVNPEEVSFSFARENNELVRSTLNQEYMQYIQSQIDILQSGRISLMNRSLELDLGFQEGVSPLVGEENNFPRQWTLKLLSLEPASWAAISDTPEATAVAKMLIRWLENWEEIMNTTPESVPHYWTPYTVSRRICNLVRLGGALSTTNSANTSTICKVLARDVEYMRDNVEYDVGGNHLIENGCALLAGGAVLSDTESVEQGVQILREELPSQILGDGMHFEKSTMYHSILLYNLTWCIDIVYRHGFSKLDDIESLLHSMYTCLHSIAPGEADIPLLNDSVYNECPPRTSCLSLAEKIFNFTPPTSRILTGESGYLSFESGDLTLLVDGGTPCPDHLPGHAHNDVGNIILWVNDEEVLTDTGVYDYEPGPRRNYARSVKSHNTIQVSESDQAITQGRFKLGPRPNPKRRYLDHDESVLEIRFISPLFIRNYQHTRVIRSLTDKIGFQIVDEVHSDGSPWISRLHLSPNIITDIQDQTVLAKTPKGESLSISIKGADSVEITETEYYPEYGSVRSQPTIEAEVQSKESKRIIHELQQTL